MGPDEIKFKLNLIYVKTKFAVLTCKTAGVQLEQSPKKSFVIGSGTAVKCLKLLCIWNCCVKMDTEKMLKQLLQEIKQNAAKAEQANAELTANMNAKFEQITANAEINNAELTAKVDAQKSTLTEALEHSNADINACLLYTSRCV